MDAEQDGGVATYKAGSSVWYYDGTEWHAAEIAAVLGNQT